jgi:DNA-binding MarR family transcriptional regulator
MSTTIDNNVFLFRNLKGLLQEKLWLLDDRLKQKRLASRYKTLTDAEARILATLRGEELTISEIARRLDVSRQAVHKVVSNLVKVKLFKLEPVPGSARDKRIVFTQEGKALRKEAEKALRELEQEVETAIGTKNFRLLKSLLGKKW